MMNPVAPQPEKGLATSEPPGLGLPQVVGGEAGKRRVRTGEDREPTILPKFGLSGAVSDETVALRTLDDLATATPGLLVATRSRR